MNAKQKDILTDAMYEQSCDNCKHNDDATQISHNAHSQPCYDCIVHSIESWQATEKYLESVVKQIVESNVKKINEKGLK